MPAPPENLFIYELAPAPPGDFPQPGAFDGFLGAWVEDDTVFLFFERPDEASARRLAGGREIVRRHEMPYAAWSGPEALAPRLAGRWRIVPPWPEPPTPGADDIILDPGVVFGGGEHPTTRHCLEAMEELIGLGRPPARALDLGCGSGLLGLAALKSGVGEVLAVDLNPLCVHVANRNARLNGLEERLHAWAGDAVAAAVANPEVELVMANLDAAVLKRLFAAGGLSGRAALILSGITRSQAGFIQDLAAAAGYAMVLGLEAGATWWSFLWRGENP